MSRFRLSQSQLSAICDNAPLRGLNGSQMDADAMTTEKRKRLNVVSVFLRSGATYCISVRWKGKEGMPAGIPSKFSWLGIKRAGTGECLTQWNRTCHRRGCFLRPVRRIHMPCLGVVSVLHRVQAVMRRVD